MIEYGDEDFIRVLQEGQEEAVGKDIRRGVALVDGETVVFREREILQGRLWMRMPEQFELLGKELARLKYPSENRPDIIYSDPAATINVSFSYKQDRLSDGQQPQHYIPPGVRYRGLL